jgi:hypothetical protein
MPTVGTETLTIRVRSEIKRAIQKDAKRRRITTNKALALLLEERFFVADDSQKTDEVSQHLGQITVRDIDED